LPFNKQLSPQKSPRCMVFHRQLPFWISELQKSCRTCVQSQFPGIQRTGPVGDHKQFSGMPQPEMSVTDPLQGDGQDGQSGEGLDHGERCNGNWALPAQDECPWGLVKFSSAGSPSVTSCRWRAQLQGRSADAPCFRAKSLSLMYNIMWVTRLSLSLSAHSEIRRRTATAADALLPRADCAAPHSSRDFTLKLTGFCLKT
jgi:hypothetical protein